jgi:hypothetical protein
MTNPCIGQVAGQYEHGDVAPRRHIRRRWLAGNQVIGVRRVESPAFSPFVRLRQVEHASRTPHDGFRRDQKEVPARLPVRHPAEAIQRGVQ